MTFETVGRQLDFVLLRIASVAAAYTRQIWGSVISRLAEEKKRAEISGLLSLEESQLRDMGISKDDVRSALMKPLDFNSGRYLEGIRRRNRLN